METTSPPSFTRRRAWLGAALGWLATPVGAQAQRSREVDRRFAVGVAYYRTGAWSRAYGEFLALANDGHPDAARIVLFMHRMGPPLYGSYWDLGTGEQAELEQIAATGPARRSPPAYCEGSAAGSTPARRNELNTTGARRN